MDISGTRPSQIFQVPLQVLAALLAAREAVTGTSQTVSLTGPSSSSTDFDLYLQKKSGSSWSSVASSTNAGSTESISYSGTSGTYRVRVYSYSGSGSFSTTWCR